MESTQNWKIELKRISKLRSVHYTAAALVALLALRVGINLILHHKAKDVTTVVEIVHPTARTIDNSLSLPGNFEAIEQASMYAHIAGYLKKIYVDEGDKVKKGQLMATIDAPDATQEYNRAKADADLGNVTLKRNRELLKENVISQQEFDTVNASAQNAQARLDNAIANVNYMQIRAPFDGNVARRFKYPGDLIEIGGKGNETPLFIVVNEDTLRMAINVPQIDVTRIQIGFTVDIAVDALAGTVLHGSVSRLDDLLDSSTKTQRALIDIPNPSNKLHAGMFATITLHLDHKDNALAIPKEAVTQDTISGKSWVWAVKDGKLTRITVTLGIRDQNWAEVLTGLTATDSVVLSSSDSFAEGTAVDTREAKH
jgi:RND family efflux transporter MFP subunit